MADKTANTTKNNLFDVTKIMSDFRVPGVDLDAVVSMQRKNIEALAQANQLAVEGVQAVMRLQFDMARQAMEGFSAMFRDLLQPAASPAASMAKQAEYSKQAIEKGLSNVREITELATKANTEAFNVINKRVTQGLAEVGDFAKKSGAAH
jgi:phasin family protein